MDLAEKLFAIEQIKALKARYCRLLDQKKWDEWRDVFAEDVVLKLAAWQEPNEVKGRDALIATVRPLIEQAMTVHQIHGPEIEILSADEATGIWALHDKLRWPADQRNVNGWSEIEAAGHYTERYRRIDGAWKIAETELSRLYFDGRKDEQDA